MLRASLPGPEGGGLFRIANLQKAEMAKEDLDLIQRAQDAARHTLATGNRPEQKALSAELNAILSFEDEFDQKPVLHHELLVTDTFVCQVAAEILSDFLQSQNTSAQPWVIKDLRTARGDELRTALSSIVPDLVQRIENSVENGWDVVFNLTGGFKGVNGFLQTAAMLWASETIYLFAGSQELMHIPRLPVSIDIDGVIEENFSLFRHMANGKAVGVKTLREAGIAGSLLFEDEGKAVLSEWGQLIWGKTYHQLASSKLLDPPHPDIVFTNAFRRSIAGLEGERMRQVNKAIAAHGLFMEGKPGGQLKSNTFKQLKGKTLLPSTHERYAWNDASAKRIYMHQENGKWVIDELGDHL